MLRQEGSTWVWQDGRGGYTEFLCNMTSTNHTEVLEEGTLAGVSIHTIQAGTDWKPAYLESSWFGDIYRFLDEGVSPKGFSTPLKALEYYLDPSTSLLHYHHPHYDLHMLCIPESWVL